MNWKIIIFFFLISPLTFGHGEKKHKKKEDEGWETITEKVSSKKLDQINSLYSAKVELPKDWEKDVKVGLKP